MRELHERCYASTGNLKKLQAPDGEFLQVPS